VLGKVTIQVQGMTNQFSSQKVKTIPLTGVFLALAISFQFMGLQFLTGTAINALLICLIAIRGPKPACALGILTPLCAFLTGILPLPLVPFAPFIAISNCALALSYHALKGRHGLFRILLPAGLKTTILHLSAYLLLRMINFAPGLKLTMATMAGLQILTALIGIILGESIAARLKGSLKQEEGAAQ
jgi:hypothetical protein